MNESDIVLRCGRISVFSLTTVESLLRYSSDGVLKIGKLKIE